MSLPRSILFVDGENLTIRYQEMVASGFTPTKGLNRTQDVFVWHDSITQNKSFNLDKVIRVNYYTSVVGDDMRVADIKRQLSQIQFHTKRLTKNY